MEQSLDCDHWLLGGGGEWHSRCPGVLWWPEKPVGMTDVEQKRKPLVTELGERAGLGKGFCLAFYMPTTTKVKKIFCLPVLEIKVEKAL